MRPILGCIALLLLVTLGSALQLDIHVDVDASSVVHQQAVALNAAVPDNNVSFAPKGPAVPHITLYLTDFQEQYAYQVVATAKHVMQAASCGDCALTMADAVASGNYGLWMITNRACLQHLSNAMVVALSPYIVPNQPVPDWVKALPEPERSEKIALIKKYGSPNVFDGFAPHITFAWADNATALSNAVQQVRIPPHLSFVPSAVSIGHVGPHGTVLAANTVAHMACGQAPAAPLDNSWDFLLLIQRWPGTITQKSLPSDVDSFTLHGVWPTRNDTSYPSDCDNSDPFDASKIQDLLPQLRAVWTDITDVINGNPNSTSFWSHEWDKHGTCSLNVLPTQHGFFSKAIALHNQFNLLGWLTSSGVTPSNDNKYSFTQIYDAMKKGSNNVPPLIMCDSGSGELMRIGYCLDKNFQAFYCPSAVFEQWKDRDNCDHSSIGFRPIQH